LYALPFLLLAIYEQSTLSLTKRTDSKFGVFLKYYVLDYRFINCLVLYTLIFSASAAVELLCCRLLITWRFSPYRRGFPFTDVSTRGPILACD